MELPLPEEPAGPGHDGTLSLGRYKDLLGENCHRIRLHDALVGEFQALRGGLGEDQFPVRNTHNLGVEDYLARVDRYEAMTRPLLPIMAVGGYWGGEEHAQHLGRCLARLADPPGDRSGLTHFINLRLYPALLLTYACGIGSILAGRYGTLAKILICTRTRKDNKQAPLVRALVHTDVIGGDLLQKRPELERHKTPTSDHLFTILKEPLSTLAIDEVEYQGAFDRFEYLYALVHGDLYQKEGSMGRIWGPIGCFLWRTGILEEVGHEIAEQGNNWLPLKAGFFGGSLERANEVREQINGLVYRNGF